MLSSKVLVIGTYPISRSVQGGPKRVAAIIQLYRSMFSQVKYVAVYNKVAHPAHGSDDIAVSQGTLKKIEQSPHSEDILCGEAISEDLIVKRKLTKVLLKFRPEIIQLEQVYPYIGLKELLKELNLTPRIIYSSHNIEHEMKKEIYANVGIPVDQATRMVETIINYEKLLATDADLSIAVSAQDASTLMDLGAKKVVTAPNGIASVPLSGYWVRYWKKYFKKRGINRTYLFVSSAHVPNWLGFEAMVGPSLGFLEADERVVLAGSVCDLAERMYGGLSPDQVTFWKRAEVAGRLSEASLAALISVCDAILLPITEGGGSNLKTAEALLSGKNIIATPYAFRAYESFMGLPVVRLAKSKSDFHEQMRSIRSTATEGKPADRVEDVLWNEALRPLKEELESI